MKSACPPTDRQHPWTAPVVSLFLAVAVGVAFGRAIHHDFVNLDDNLYVYENPVVQQGLTFAGAIWAFTDLHSFNWHPATWLSHMLDCQLYELNPGGHHLTSVLIHAATVVLLFLVLRRMTGALWRSAFAAALFGLHPLRVESVAWIAERKDVLSGLFFVLTLWAYARYVSGEATAVKRESRSTDLRPPTSVLNPSSIWYGSVLAFFTLGLMCKPMLVTVPFVLLLLDFWPLNRWSPVPGEPALRLAWGTMPRRLLCEKLPMLGLAAAVCAVTVFAQDRAIQPLPFSLRLGNALVTAVAYLGQMFYPANLAVYYPHPGNDLPFWKAAAALGLLLLVSAVAVAGRRKRPWLLTGWLWYLGMLVPVVGIIQVGSQARADRYTYLPQIGIALLLTWLVADGCAGWRHRGKLLAGFAAAVLTALICCARMQTARWQDSETLWTHALACTSDNVIARGNLASALLKKGRADEAIAHCQAALRIEPDDADARIILGSALLQKGAAAEAIAHFRAALRSKPDYAAAHNNLGNALMQNGSVDEASAHFRRALEINAQNPEAHNNLGNARLQMGDLDGAINCFLGALRIKPRYAEAQYNLGNALLRKDRLDEALNRFREALRLKPDYAEAHLNLGNALLQKRSLDEALQHYQMALQFKPDSPDAQNNLGFALLQKGSADEAIPHFQAALQGKPAYAEAAYNLGTALLRKGNAEAAMLHYRRALAIQPDHPEALNDLAWLLATSEQTTLRDSTKAVELAERANRLTAGKNPNVLSTLAAAYAAAGRFADAGSIAEKAIAQARAANRPDMVEQFTGELKRYAAGLPLAPESK